MLQQSNKDMIDITIIKVTSERWPSLPSKDITNSSALSLLSSSLKPVITSK